MSSPETYEQDAIDEREKVGNSATESTGVPMTTDLASLQQNIAKYDLCQISDTNQQNINFQKSNGLHSSVFRKCIECSNLKETNESCFNLLENKLEQRSQSYLARERISNEKGLLRSFGKTLEHCSNCGSLQIHRLFAENEEDSVLRLNLGGFSPVLCHNVFKTCESKGDDMDCRLVILGARPRSSPAHAVLSEHTKPCPTFCQECNYQSPDPHSNHQLEEVHPLPHLYDHHPSFYEVSGEKSSSQHNQLKAGSSHSSSELSLLLDKVSSCNDPVPITSHLSIESSSHLKVLPSPSLQSVTPPVLCSFAKSVSYEGASEMAGSTLKSCHSVDAEDMSGDAKKYTTSSQLESNLSRVHSLVICEPGRKLPFDTSSHSHIEPNAESPFKGDNTKVQKKRTLSVLDEKEHLVPEKKHNCKGSSVLSFDELNVRNAYSANNSNSIILKYSEPCISETIVKTECADTPIPMTTVAEISKSQIRIQPYFAPITSQCIKPMGERPISALTQTGSADSESILNSSSQVSNPMTNSERTEGGLGKFGDLENTGTIDEKAGTEVGYSKARCELKEPVSRWSNEDVICFLKGTDCGEYSDVFIQEDIDGQALLLLNEEKLHNLLGIKMGPAMKIAQHIRNLQGSPFGELETVTGR